jgi:3-isopropylmalate/(R)-2-methylmalate dehydratase small subunit
MKIEGRVWTFKDNDINTDLIYPGKYTYEPLTPEEQASHAMEDYDTSFIKKIQHNDIIVSGEYFGCGSSREQAVTCLKQAGISAVIAKSFARLFYRNAINSALAVIECPILVEAVFNKIENRGSTLTDFSLSIDLEKGEIHYDSEAFPFPPWDRQAMLIFQAGGLIEFTKQKLKNRSPEDYTAR